MNIQEALFLGDESHEAVKKVREYAEKYAAIEWAEAQGGKNDGGVYFRDYEETADVVDKISVYVSAYRNAMKEKDNEREDK